MKLSKQAVEAINRGIDRGDCVAEMEALGLPQRTINALEESKYQIHKLEQLMNRTIDDLNQIPNVGDRAIEAIFDCLGRYYELEEIEAAYESAI